MDQLRIADCGLRIADCGLKRAKGVVGRQEVSKPVRAADPESPSSNQQSAIRNPQST